MVLPDRGRRWVALRFAEFLCSVGRATSAVGARVNRSGERLWKRTVFAPPGVARSNRNAVSRWYRNYVEDFDHGSVRTVRTPTISILLPLRNASRAHFEGALASIVAQGYADWELLCLGADQALTDRLPPAACTDPRIKIVPDAPTSGHAQAVNAGLAHATGEYILMFDATDALEPHALASLAAAAVQDRGDLVYADEAITRDEVDDIAEIHARPQFAYLYYLSHPYFARPVLVRTTLARQVGGLREDLPAAQEVDFILRCIEHARRVTHVPDVLYRSRLPHLRDGDRAQTMRVGAAVRQEHLRRMGYADATVRPGRSFNTFSYRFFGHSNARVLGIVPTHNGVDLLARCIETVRATTPDVALDLIVVDHDSDDPATLAYLRRIEGEGTARVLPYSGRFNFSAINNRAVRDAGARYDHLLFLNNDIEAIEDGWLEAMVDLATLDNVGAVGGVLLYPDRRVQHGGVFVGNFGPAEHAFRFSPYGAEEAGYLSGLHATREFSAVTGACMLVPARVFEEVGGFDEHLHVGFNDIDLCLRIGALGYSVVNSADALLVHHESATRGQSRDDPHPEDTYLFSRRYPELLRDGDPYYTPLLSRTSPRFEFDAARKARAAPRPRTLRLHRSRAE